MALASLKFMQNVTLNLLGPCNYWKLTFVFFTLISRAVNSCLLKYAKYSLKYAFISQKKKLFPNTTRKTLYNIEYSSASVHIFL